MVTESLGWTDDVSKYLLYAIKFECFLKWMGWISRDGLGTGLNGKSKVDECKRA